MEKSGVLRFVITLLGLLSLSGCGYKAKLLQSGPLGESVPIKVYTPRTNSDQQGLLVLFKTSPDVISGGVAFEVDDKYAKDCPLLLTALQKDDFSSFFTDRLNRKFKIINYADPNIAEYYTDEKLISKKDFYCLTISVQYGISGKTGQLIGTLSGKLLRASDQELVWKNRITYQSNTPFMHTYSECKNAVNYRSVNYNQYRRIIANTNIELADLLILELTDLEMLQPFTPVKAYRTVDNELLKAQILDMSSRRVLLRTTNGELRSLPKNAFVSELKPIFSLL